MRNEKRKVVKGEGFIVAALGGYLHGGDGEGNHSVRRLITTTNNLFDTEVGMHGGKD